jgi:hypothetical protein
MVSKHWIAGADARLESISQAAVVDIANLPAICAASALLSKNAGAAAGAPQQSIYPVRRKPVDSR